MIFYYKYQGGGHTSDQCHYDHLTVFAGPELSSPQLIKMCNRNSQNITLTSQGNIMLLVFKYVVFYFMNCCYCIVYQE